MQCGETKFSKNNYANVDMNFQISPCLNMVTPALVSLFEHKIELLHIYGQFVFCFGAYISRIICRTLPLLKNYLYLKNIICILKHLTLFIWTHLSLSVLKPLKNILLYFILK